jgi:ABC-type dipeptide/oligopeptide/nickel transport system permease component
VRVAAALARALVLLWLASVAAFAIGRAMPADPAVLALLAFDRPATPEAVAALHAQWGLDRPLPQQYLAWLAGFVAGDWHRSFRTGTPIRDEIIHRLPVSLALGCGGLALAALLALPLARAAALRPRGAADRVLDALIVVAQAVPAFWLACMLIWLLSVELRWLTVLGDGGWQRLVLPIALVALSAIGPLAAVVRTGLREVARSLYLTAALAKGLGRRAALARHGTRYAALGLLAALGAEAGWAFGGAAVIEVVFGLPGISQFVVESIAARDYFVLQAYVVVAAAWMIAVGLVAELVRGRLDPRPA